MSYLDLKADGPLVVEVPPGVQCMFDDFFQRPLVGPEIVARGAAAGGLSWHYARPPVVGLEYEMDVRGAARELML